MWSEYGKPILITLVVIAIVFHVSAIRTPVTGLS